MNLKKYKIIQVCSFSFSTFETWTTYYCNQFSSSEVSRTCEPKAIGSLHLEVAMPIKWKVQILQCSERCFYLFINLNDTLRIQLTLENTKVLDNLLSFVHTFSYNNLQLICIEIFDQYYRNHEIKKTVFRKCCAEQFIPENDLLIHFNLFQFKIWINWVELNWKTVVFFHINNLFSFLATS